MEQAPLVPPEDEEPREKTERAPKTDEKERAKELDKLRSILFSGSVEEHRDTLEFLKQAVDEARPSHRKFFS